MSEAQSFDQEFLDLSARIQTLLTIDPSTGDTTAPKDFYTQIGGTDDLPVELQEKSAKRLDLVTNATLHAFGQVSVQAAKDNPALQSTELSVNMLNKDKLTAAIQREKSGKVGDKPYHKHGVLSVSYVHSACRPKSGTLGTVAAGIAAQFAGLAS